MASSTSKQATSSSEPRWGRVLICGGTDWPRLGRKGGGANKRGQEEPTGPDLLEPHILRSLSNIKAISIHTSCAGCHVVVLDIDGAAWLFGRNERCALGVAGKDVISENAPIKLTAHKLGASNDTKFVNAACGRNHTLLVGSDGQLWSAGANNMGQCGHSPSHEVTTFKLVNGPKLNGNKERVVKAAAGINFSIVLTDTGRVFSFGSGEKGQLGNGKTGEHIVTGGKTVFDAEWEPIPVKGLDDKNIVQIACGQQHTIALDDTGVVYVWGYNGYCRLGLGNQQDILIPKVVPAFAGPNEITMGAQVIAGPSNSVVIDKQGMYWMAGKWKNTGDGSSGQPYSSFRFLQDIASCKMKGASCGGVAHFALAPDEDGSMMTICFGQAASNGELGLGPDEPKSATKPIQHQPLVGVNVFQVSAAQNTTFFLAEYNEKFNDLPRHPEDTEPPENCVVCDKDNGDDDSPLECDKCAHPYHLGCLEPPLDAVPDGEWFCPECEADPEAPIVIGAVRKPLKKGRGGKPVAKAPPPQDEDEHRGHKRKASDASKTSAPKRKK